MKNKIKIRKRRSIKYLEQIGSKSTSIKRSSIYVTCSDTKHVSLTLAIKKYKRM